MRTDLVKSADWQGQIPLVKSMVAKGATDEEFALMCHIAVKYGLDPLLKQVWVVKYGNNPASIFTGRDGFLSIAHRTGQFNGIETVVEKVSEPIHVEKQKWDKKQNKYITISVKREWQYKATCTIRRKDCEFPFVTEVYEEEYTTCENLWVTKPRTMIGKVSESQNTRKAFDISGLYAPEEMPEMEERDITPRPDVSAAQAEFERKKGIASEPATEPQPEPEQPTETPEEKAKREKGEKRAAIMNAMPKDIQEYLVSALKKGLKLVDWFQMIADNEQDPERIRGWMQDHPLVEPVADLSQLINESMLTVVPPKDELF